MVGTGCTFWPSDQRVSPSPKILQDTRVLTGRQVTGHGRGAMHQLPAIEYQLFIYVQAHAVFRGDVESMETSQERLT
jgi:hypothetical protein